jgi:hypothetical protein
MHDALLSQAALYGLKNAREMHPVTSRLPETADNLASFDSCMFLGSASDRTRDLKRLDDEQVNAFIESAEGRHFIGLDKDGSEVPVVLKKHKGDKPKDKPSLVFRVFEGDVYTIDTNMPWKYPRVQTLESGSNNYPVLVCKIDCKMNLVDPHVGNTKFFLKPYVVSRRL